MTLREVWRALRATWWLSVLGLIAGGAAALGFCALRTPLYSSSTQFFVSTPAAVSAADAFEGSQLAQQRVTSYVALLQGEELQRRVVDRIGGGLTTRQLSREISVNAPTESVLVDVTVEDPSPQRAQLIAETVGTEFTAMAAQLEAPAPGGRSSVRVSVSQPPALPRTPSSPDYVRTTAYGAVLGLILGLCVALARGRLDRSVKTVDDLTDLGGSPVVGAVVRDKGLALTHVVNLARGGRVVEDYRRLRANLDGLGLYDDAHKVVLVAGVDPGDGATTLAINLGLVLAETGRRVAIIEADLRHPSMTRYLGLVDVPGLSDVLVGSTALEEVDGSYRENLFVVPSGGSMPNLGAQLGSAGMRTVMEKLRADHDVVLVQGPSLTSVADSSSLAAHCDSALVAARYGRTRKDRLREAVGLVQRAGLRAIGIVVNAVPAHAGPLVVGTYDAREWDGTTHPAR